MDRQGINFKKLLIHPEEEPDINELNQVATLAKQDLIDFDKCITETTINFNSLLNSTRLKLINIKDMLNSERERQQDINILCNKYSEFSSVMNLSQKDFQGNLSFSDEILQATIVSKKNVDYKIIAIDGNGFAGNKYVYLNNSFLDSIIDTSSIKNINDSNLATNYEYSRITITNDTEAPPNFNKDSIEAECSIWLSSPDLFNHINIDSERDDLILKEVYTSLDGLTFTLDKEYNVSINSRIELYNDSTYVYGSGILCITPSRHIKMVFRSNGYTDDSIAYIKTFYDETINNSIVKKIVKLDTAKRHLIKINDIKLLKNSYSKGMIISKELITTPIKCISIYCNEYINKDYSIDKNVAYYLILNGQEYKLEPINSHRNGKKIIRTSSQVYKSEHVIYLNEEIKSAKLKIVINTTNTDISPYISDIKVLIGG